MEFTSIIVHALFVLLQLVSISLLPLGKRLIRAVMNMKPVLVAVVLANFVLAAFLYHFWGMTALVVSEVVGVVGALVLVGRGDEELLRGIKVLEKMGARRVVAVTADRYLFAWGKGVIYSARTEADRDAWVREYLESGQPAWIVTEEQAANLVAKDPEFWAFRDMPRQNPND